MTRDSHWWWFWMACSIVMWASSRMDQIDPFLPMEHTDKVHAIIEFLALLAGMAFALCSASPINKLSDEARAKYLNDYIRLRPLDADD